MREPESDGGKLLAIAVWIQASAAGLLIAGAVILYGFLQVLGGEDPVFEAALRPVFPFWAYPALGLGVAAAISAALLAKGLAIGRAVAFAQWSLNIVHAIALSVQYGLAGALLLTNLTLAAGLIWFLLRNPKVQPLLR